MESQIQDVVVSGLIKKVLDVAISKDYRRKNPLEQDYNLIFEEYLKKTQRKLCILNTIVLKNQQILLDDIYLPLTLVKDSEREEFLIDKFPKKLVEKYGLVLITDTAGMGKSTLMKKMFLTCLFEEYAIPIFVELRRIKSHESIIQYLKDELKFGNLDADPNILEYLFEQGHYVFYFDGYDEIELESKAKVSKSLQDFINKFSENNYFFLTSRPEPSLASFGEFQGFNIKKLTLNESFELIRKYDTSGKTSPLLINQLQGDNLTNIHEFLENPLLVSLLYLAFEYKKTIPFKKHLFYRQVFEANFDSHDLTKGESFIRTKRSGLSLDEFDRILRQIAFSCLRIQKIEFEIDQILQLIEESKSSCPDLNFQPSDLLNDLLNAVPLFSKDGNYYKWAHRSIQEYFAAQFIFKDSKDQKAAILKRIFNHNNVNYFNNTLQIYSELDYKSCREVIEYNLLLDFSKHKNDFYQHTFDKKLDPNEIKLRMELNFCFKYLLIQDSNKLLIEPKNYNNQKLSLSPENNKRVWDAAVKYKIELGENWEVEGMVIFPRQGINTYLVRIVNQKIYLLDIFRRFSIKYFIQIKAPSHRINMPFSTVNKDKVFRLEDFQSYVNKKKFFNDVNNLIMINRGSESMISTDAALDELRIIEEEKSQIPILSLF